MCKRIYYLCRHAPYVQECAEKYEEASCCFGGGGCGGITENVTRPEYCPNCKAKKAPTRGPRKNDWYGQNQSSSRGAKHSNNNVNSNSSRKPITEPKRTQGVTATPRMGTYDTRNRRAPQPVQPIQPAYIQQGRRNRDAPPGRPIVRDMPSIHQASNKPRIQGGYVAAQPMSATLVYPTPPAYHNSQQRQPQRPQMSSVQRPEPPSFSRHMQQHTTTAAQKIQQQRAPPPRQMSRHAQPQAAPQRAQRPQKPVRKPTRRDSNGISECGSDDEGDSRPLWTPSPQRASFPR